MALFVVTSREYFGKEDAPDFLIAGIFDLANCLAETKQIYYCYYVEF